ncbi:MAG: DUF58 domain-containing protein [Anaerolineales bacterium]|nr:DUF58 domain-containing protein [Anaerolineales bacterium]
MFRSLLLSLLAYGLIVFGLLTLHGDILTLSIPLVIYLLSGLLRAPQEINLSVERKLSLERTGADMPVRVTLRITNAGATLEDVLITDKLSSRLKILEGSARHLVHLAKGQTITLAYTASGPRGYYPFPGLRVEARDHFGLIKREETIPTPGQLFILPSVLRLKQITIRTRKTRVYSGNIPARVGGHGVEFFGLREYQAGDSPRWINWRASARHAFSMFSNEFEQERVADVGIILDGRLKTNIFDKGHSLFEYSVLAAAALADVLLSQGNRVGLLNYGRFLQWTFPGYGKFQRERILQALTHAQVGSSTVFSELEYIPARLFPTHSQIILVSPLDAEDVKVLVQLRARGYQVMVISPDPVAFELSYLPKSESVDQAARLLRMERNLLIHKLQRAGIQVLDWNVSQPFDQVVKRQLGRPPALLRAIGGQL